MKHLKYILSAVFLLQCLLFSQTIVPISSVRNNDANGVSTSVGQTVTVTGIVTATTQFGSSGPGALQDATGGISFYGSSLVPVTSIGDSVVITAKLTNYNGLAELSYSSGSSIQIISSGHQVEPEVVTIAQI